MFLRLIILFLTPFVWANTPKTQIWSTFNQLSQGDIQGVTLLSSGELEAGYPVKAWTRDLPSAATALVSWEKNLAYIATSGPSQIWEISPEQKPKLVLELKQPLVTGLFKMPNGELAVLSSPKGGVTFVRPDSPKKTRFISLPGTLLGAYLQGDSLSVVGDNSQIFKITGAKLEKKPVLPKENQLRSIYQDYYGTASTGTIYHNQAPILKSSGEVVAITGNKKEIFAAINTTKNSSQLWRVSPKKSSCLIWESSSEIIHSLVYLDEKLFWGTGPNGHLFSGPPKCSTKVDLLLSLPEHHRFVSLAPNKSKILVATGNTGALFELDLSQKAKSGTFVTPVAKLEAPAKIQSSSATLWLGNSPKRDTNWWNFESNKELEAQYAQAQVTITPEKSVDKIFFTYTLPEIEIRIQSVTAIQKEDLLEVTVKLNSEVQEPELEYQYELESLEADKLIIQPHAKTLSVNYDSSKLPKGYYRVLVYSEKDNEHPAGESEWFEVK